MIYYKLITRKVIVFFGIFYEKGQDYFLRMDFFERVPSTRYQPSKLYEVKKIFKKIPTENRNFLDIGSGKGAVLYLATKFNFLNIYGIEYNKDLYLISMRNLNRLNENRLKIINEDIFNAKDELIDCVDIYYFFNPFNSEFEIKKLLELIIMSFMRLKRRIDIIYTCCTYSHVFADFNLIKEVGAYNFLISYSPTKHYLIDSF